MKRSRLFLFLFLTVSAGELLGVSMDWQLLQTIAKPLIVLSLIGHYASNVARRSSIFILALFFCWAGDVLLQFQANAELFFIFGLVAFLMGHILYILTYRQHQWKEAKNEFMTTQKLRYAFPVVLAGTGLITLLFPSLGDLKIPVIIYAVVLMLMVMAALFRYGRTSSESFWSLFTGAGLFMISDSALAINKFYTPLPYSGLIIMTSYILAQYLIVEGIVRHE